MYTNLSIFVLHTLKISYKKNEMIFLHSSGKLDPKGIVFSHIV